MNPGNAFTYTIYNEVTQIYLTSDFWWCNLLKIIDFNLINIKSSCMKTTTQKRLVWLNIIRWTARILALLIIIFILFMFIGESIGSSSRKVNLSARDFLLLSLFGITLIGLGIGFWREGLGGLISLVSTLSHIIFLSINGVGNLFYFYVFLVPSILYLMYWYFNKTIKARVNSTPV